MWVFLRDMGYKVGCFGVVLGVFWGVKWGSFMHILHRSQGCVVGWLGFDLFRELRLVEYPPHPTTHPIPPHNPTPLLPCISKSGTLK